MLSETKQTFKRENHRQVRSVPALDTYLQSRRLDPILKKLSCQESTAKYAIRPRCYNALRQTWLNCGV